jgi:F0F1-type ATP synthase beta subunit
MPSEKTKKLLEGLGKITDSAPSKFEQQKFHSYTNRYYPNTIHTLPASYNKAKKKKDEDGDEYIMIDRVYGSLYESSLHQKDGTVYTGKLYSKRRLITGKNAQGEKVNFYSPCTSTADGRWFDNTGMPIDAPDKLEPEKQKSPEEIEEQQRQLIERAKNREAAILANLK